MRKITAPRLPKTVTAVVDHGSKSSHAMATITIIIAQAIVLLRLPQDAPGCMVVSRGNEASASAAVKPPATGCSGEWWRQ